MDASKGEVKIRTTSSGHLDDCCFTSPLQFTSILSRQKRRSRALSPAAMVLQPGDILQNGGPGPSTTSRRETMEKVMARLEREFPDRTSGSFLMNPCQAHREGQSDPGLTGIEESLAQHEEIQNRLHTEIRAVKQEIASLVTLLKRDQDPTKMGRIQAQIGVSADLISEQVHWSSILERGTLS